MNRTGGSQLIEEIHAIIEACGVEVTDNNGAEYNQRHGEIYYCDFDEDQGEEVYRIPFPHRRHQEGDLINGIGYDAHFPFIMEDGGWAFMISVETAHKPYDDVVTCILLRAFMFAPNACRNSSDALWDEWEPARSIYRHLFDEEPEYPWGEYGPAF